MTYQVCELKANAGARVQAVDNSVTRKERPFSPWQECILMSIHLWGRTPFTDASGEIMEVFKPQIRENMKGKDMQGSWTDRGCLVWHWIWTHHPIKPCVGDTTLLAWFLVGRETPGQCWLMNVSPKAHTWQACTRNSLSISNCNQELWKFITHECKQIALTQLSVTNKQPVLGESSSSIAIPNPWSRDSECPISNKYYVSSWTYVHSKDFLFVSNHLPYSPSNKEMENTYCSIFRGCISYWLWGLLPKTTLSWLCKTSAIFSRSSRNRRPGDPNVEGIHPSETTSASQ